MYREKKLLFPPLVAYATLSQQNKPAKKEGGSADKALRLCNIWSAGSEQCGKRVKTYPPGLSFRTHANAEKKRAKDKTYTLAYILVRSSLVTQ